MAHALMLLEDDDTVPQLEKCISYLQELTEDQKEELPGNILLANKDAINVLNQLKNYRQAFSFLMEMKGELNLLLSFRQSLKELDDHLKGKLKARPVEELLAELKQA